MENKRQHPRKRGSATDLASIGRDAVNNIDVFRHRCVALDARKPMTMGVGDFVNDFLGYFLHKYYT